MMSMIIWDWLLARLLGRPVFGAAAWLAFLWHPHGFLQECASTHIAVRKAKTYLQLGPSGLAK